MATCGACNTVITDCTECGGKMCTDGCADRANDGCTCAKKEDNDVVIIED